MFYAPIVCSLMLHCCYFSAIHIHVLCWLLVQQLKHVFDCPLSCLSVDVVLSVRVYLSQAFACLATPPFHLILWISMYIIFVFKWNGNKCFMGDRTTPPWTSTPRTITPQTTPPWTSTPRTIPTQISPTPDSSHPGKLPPGQFPTRTTPHRIITPRTITIPDNYPPDNWPTDNCQSGAPNWDDFITLVTNKNCACVLYYFILA